MKHAGFGEPMDWPMDVFETRLLDAMRLSTPEEIRGYFPNGLQQANQARKAERREAELRALGLPPLILP